MKTIVSLILATLCTFARAEFVSGEILHHLFNGDKQAQDQAIGYAVGVHDATMGTAHCSHEALTGAALREMTRKMLEDAGPMRALSADALIAAMLKEAFPCEEKAPAATPAPKRGKLEA